MLKHTQVYFFRRGKQRASASVLLFSAAEGGDGAPPLLHIWKTHLSMIEVVLGNSGAFSWQGSGGSWGRKPGKASHPCASFLWCPYSALCVSPPHQVLASHYLTPRRPR